MNRIVLYKGLKYVRYSITNNHIKKINTDMFLSTFNSNHYSVLIYKNIILLLFLLIGITSCVEKFWPEINDYENIIVVDGLLTNEDNPGEIKLSVSSSIDDAELIPVSGADLYILDNQQTEIHLIETDPGLYRISDSSFRAIVGASYQLHILLPNGNRLESDFCQLAEAAPIDTVYGLIESHENLNYNHDIQGIQFYIDNHNNNSDTCNYLWNLFQTFEYRSSFNIDYTWEGEFIRYPNPDSLRTCWITRQVNSIFTFSTRYLDKPVLTRFPLNYVSTQRRELSIRYSLLVKQLSISNKAYDYWSELQQQNSSQGNIYSQQPVQIKGNVYNVNNPEELVLGYFTVAGVSEKRIYLNRPGLAFYYGICEPDYPAMRFIRYEPPNLWPIYIVIVPITGAMARGANAACFDCREDGGSLTPPDFWKN